MEKVNFRILKKTKGYIVEVQVSKWTLFGIKKVWKPFILTSGLDIPWHHSSYDFAMKNLLDEIELSTIKNGGFNQN